MSSHATTLTVPLCKDCRWFDNYAADTVPNPYALCRNPDQPVTDLVHGAAAFCSDARKGATVSFMQSGTQPDFRGCGPSGQLFVAMEAGDAVAETEAPAVASGGAGAA
jgi:hypothetical protein